jgi:hypothetical protein
MIATMLQCRLISHRFQDMIEFVLQIPIRVQKWKRADYELVHASGWLRNCLRFHTLVLMEECPSQGLLQLPGLQMLCIACAKAICMKGHSGWVAYVYRDSEEPEFAKLLQQVDILVKK